jgi:alanyl-tRNA synthetase
MKAAEVRSSFIEFFAAREHERVHSSPLVPANDPTLMFTNAGMVQFKDVFTGAETRSYQRATSSQKCVRAGGKHNDLDEVGKTARHQTFFEMLGNFSFGDYFKEDAIAWAWELLTDVYQLDKDRIIVTVFDGDQGLGIGSDDEARQIWKRVTGFGDDRVVGLGMKENFWMMGETGPMGPCSEIHFFQGDGKPSQLPVTESPEAAWDPWLEIWNLVFMQYERKVANGPLDKLPAPSIDTGAGLERVTSALQGVRSNYDTDLFQPLLRAAADAAGKRYGEDETADTSMRVIADHARASAFLIADGVFPDKNGREYVLRRIFRRGVRHGKLLGIEEPFMHRVCEVVVDEMKSAFPELEQRASVINEMALEEEKRFRRTLDRGLTMLEDEFERMRGAGQNTVPGVKVYQLYDTYGFPKDLTGIVAEESGFAIDEEGYEAELATAQKRSRFAGSDAEAVGAIYKELGEAHDSTEFVGYDGRGVTGDGTVLAIVVDQQRADSAETGTKVAFATNRTPFYAESGGQIGDKGNATTGSGACVRIDDCRKPNGDLFFHYGEVVEGTLSKGDTITLEVDDPRRERIRANHSATHLMHLALKRFLGDHVAQKGSLVAPDRLRFDFAHFNPMTDEQKQQVEDWVNAEIVANADSVTEVLPFAQAQERGAVAMFGEKYGETVRVVKIGGESLEFCGGTHVRRAGDIGMFKILSESGVAQGVRRIEAVTGAGAMQYVRTLERELSDAGTALKVGPLEVSARIGKMQRYQKSLEKEVADLKAKLASGGSRDLLDELVEIGGVKVLSVSTEVADASTLRTTGDTLRDKLGSGVIFLAGIGDEKVTFLAMVTQDLTDRLHAGNLLKSAAKASGGRGGGKANMAQGGAKDASKVPDALAAAVQYVTDTVGA